MIFQFKDKDGYNIDPDKLPLCPFKENRACLALDCAAFEVVYDGVSGYCGFTQGATCAARARVPVVEGVLP